MSMSTNGDRSTILVTGGCGYIGSHTITVLLEKNYNVVVVDNLDNSSEVSLDRVSEIVGLTAEERSERLRFYNIDLINKHDMRKVFEDQKSHNVPFEACIHFAGLKSVGESSRLPIKYYDHNISSTLKLLALMDEFGCNSIVFSSSATVYGGGNSMPLTETSRSSLADITNPYGKTKHMIEVILKDVYASAPDKWNIALLRYFNPIGAHPSGKIGEDPNGIPNNLMPYLSQVAIGRREYLTIFGDDYDTPDGTGVRDYLHVMDLADGHLAVMRYMHDSSNKNVHTFNLGTGNGVSVLDMVKSLEKACGRQLKYKIGPRRPGDLAFVYADATKAKKEMGWEAKRGLDEMCRDAWAWQSNNPNGFN